MGHTPVPQAMQAFPECMVEGDTVKAYRNFYVTAKSRFATWKERGTPVWYKNMTQNQKGITIG